MAEETTEQTATTENEASAAQAAEGSGEQTKSIDEILNEIDASENTEQQSQQTQTAETKPEAAADTALADRMDKLEKQLASERAASAVSDTIASIQSSQGNLKDVRPAVLEAMLEAEARQDTRIMTAWQNRANNPALWKQIEGKLAEKFAGDFPKSQLASDREAVTAAVRGSANQPPEQSSSIPPQADLAKMSDTDFDALAAAEAAKNEAA